jgi:hypothetical protein
MKSLNAVTLKTKYQADLVVQWDNFNERTIEMLTKMIFSKTINQA